MCVAATWENLHVFSFALIWGHRLDGSWQPAKQMSCEGSCGTINTGVDFKHWGGFHAAAAAAIHSTVTAEVGALVHRS